MRHKKKAIGLALIAALALSACGSKKESGGSTETTAAATETTAAATPTTSGKADDSNNVTAFVEETGGTSATSEGIVEGGTLQLGSRLPTNTDGGHLSNSYMQGWEYLIQKLKIRL